MDEAEEEPASGAGRRGGEKAAGAAANVIDVRTCEVGRGPRLLLDGRRGRSCWCEVIRPMGLRPFAPPPREIEEEDVEEETEEDDDEEAVVEVEAEELADRPLTGAAVAADARGAEAGGGMAGRA